VRKAPVPLQVIGQALRDWWDDWVNMVVVNLAWVLCWLTVLLGPPATLGLYYVTNRLAHGRSLGLGGLLEGGRRYFLKSWLWSLLNLGAAVIVWANLGFYAQIDAAWAGLLQGFFLTLGLVWLVVQFYALPYLMEQEQKHLRLALRNGLFTMLAAPGYTVVVAGLAALIGALSIALILPLFLGGPCLIAVLGNRAVLERLETYRVREREAARGRPQNDEP
jgi:uncharacterized membrane protein YesL